MTRHTPEIIDVEISDLLTDVFVRTKLDDDNVVRLAMLIEAGKKLDPITITPNREVVDGRHRIEANLLFEGVTTIKAVVVRVRDKADLITHAYQANIGGAKPPTQADTDHVIALLLAEDLNQKEIAKRIDLLPSQVRTRVAQIKKAETRRKIMAAASEVTNGDATVAAAAEEHGVDEKSLRAHLKGKSTKKVRGDRGDQLAEIKTICTSLSRRIGKLMGGVADAFGDGDMTAGEAMRVLEELERYTGRHSRNLGNWRKRVESGFAD